MTTKAIQLWRINGADSLIKIARSKLDLEERLEKWLEEDISLITDDVLVIGRQVETDYGGIIDLLGLDIDGNLVIFELKRHKTPREVVAQALDYASWIKEMTAERITEIAESFLSKNNKMEDKFSENAASGSLLEHFFKSKYKVKQLPEVFNEQHRIYIVASEIDSASERIVKYLSETHGVPINVATFDYYCDENGTEFLTRSFLMEQIEVVRRAKVSSKRNPSLTLEDFKIIAENNGVLELYEKLILSLKPLFDDIIRGRTNVSFRGYMGPKKSKNSIVVIYPGNSSNDNGLYTEIYIDRVCEYFKIEEDAVLKTLPNLSKQEGEYGAANYFKNLSEIDKFQSILQVENTGTD